MLFTFPSRYWYTIGQTGILRLTRRSGQIRTGFHGARATWDTRSGDDARPATGPSPSSAGNSIPFASHAAFITPAGPVGARTRDPTTPCTQPPTGITRARFGLIRFRSPLLTEYPFLQVLRCFTSLRTPRPHGRCHPMTGGGFPHSEILGSKPHRRLPEAYRSPARPSSVPSAKASTTRPCRQPTRAPAPASKHRTTDLRTHDHKTIRTKTRTKPPTQDGGNRPKQQ